jgi:hypothetical protein
MKSRHLSPMETLHQRRMRRLFWVVALILVGIAGAVFAQDAADPPARVAYVSFRQGSIVFAPQGDEEWVDLPPNRPLTVGDRIWTDRGARAELQLGSATLHVDGQSHLGVSDLDANRAQFILQQGTVNVRVRELLQGENMEVDTPNLAFRALQPGDYRIDVDPRTGQTRVTVQSGLASLFGEGGESIQMGAAQQADFAGRFLAEVDSQDYAPDDFALWAAERNRLEDASQAARYLPRGVVGAADLDGYGTWAQDPGYGPVWYPSVTASDWAPYRYGHWDWISPWGWTWIDDEPWGFAPFHYGRWTMIGSHWAWVPGRMAQRPVYAPALVVFFGGGGHEGWVPLAPGEAWWPVYHASRRYVSNANARIDLDAWPRGSQNHFWRNRPLGATAVGEDVFRRGAPVHRHWEPVSPQAIGQSQLHVVPVRPQPGSRGEFERQRPHLQGEPQRFAPDGAVLAAPVPRVWGGNAPLSPALREPWQRQQQEQPRRVQPQPGGYGGAVRRAQEDPQAQQRLDAQQAQREAVMRAQEEQRRRQQEPGGFAGAVRRAQQPQVQVQPQVQPQPRVQHQRQVQPQVQHQPQAQPQPKVQPQRQPGPAQQQQPEQQTGFGAAVRRIQQQPAQPQAQPQPRGEAQHPAPEHERGPRERSPYEGRRD